MPCLICRYFQPTEPAQHKVDREAGQCQSGCGKEWNQHTAINHVKNHGKLDGFCLLHPVSTPHSHAHVCGDVSVRGYFLNHYWRVEPFGPEDNIFEWACKTLGIVLHDSNKSWQEREYAHVTKQNKELQRQLKATRKISASRFARLQKIEDSKSVPEFKDQPVSESERPTEEPFYPHLVAAE